MSDEEKMPNTKHLLSKKKNREMWSLCLSNSSLEKLKCELNEEQKKASENFQ